MAKLSDVNIRSFGHTIMLAGGIYEGEGKIYLVFFPEDAKKLGLQTDNTHALLTRREEGGLPIEVLAMSLAEWADFCQQTDFLLTEVETKTPEGAPLRAIVRKCERHVDNAVSWRVYRRDGFRCRYCGDDKVPLTVDHLVCWEDGGPSIEANLVAACRLCNKARGRMLYDSWLASKDYAKASKNLPFAVKENNEALFPTLAAIPRTTHTRTR